MRFSIFKSFSLLHRRTKSEPCSAAALVAPTLNTHARSLSLNVDKQAFDIFEAVVPPTLPTPTFTPATPSFTPAAITPPIPTPSAPASAPHALKLAAIKQRIVALEAENAELKDTNASLALDIQICNEDLTAFKGDYYAERNETAVLKRQAKVDKDEVERLEWKLEEFDKFMVLMIDLGLHEPVLARTRNALLAGESADEALVDSIKEAAAKPGSPWSRIIPAVTGPRTSDEYLSAISMTLKTRKALKESKMVAKFWKKAAQEDGAHADTITPSVSNLSSIHEMLSEERQSAVDDLLKRLKNRDGSSARRVVRSRPDFDVPAVASCSNSSSTVSLSQPQQAPLIEVASTHPPLIETFTSTIQDSTDTITSYVPALAPLASQTFKEELLASHSIKRFSKIDTQKPTRTVLGSVDTNRVTPKYATDATISPSDSVITQLQKPTAKALGKRRAVVVAESFNSISASFHTTSTHELVPSTVTLSSPPESTVTSDVFTHALTSSLLTANANFSNDYREEKASRYRITGGDLPFDNSTFVDLLSNLDTKHSVADAFSTFTPEAPLALVHDNGGVLRAARALLSLERICAGFSSGSSLGSLRTISEGSETNRSPKKEVVLASTSASSSLVSSVRSKILNTILHDRHSSQESDFSFVAESVTDVVPPPKMSNTTSPVKQSKLPVLKAFRRLSMLTKPTSFRPTPSTSARQPTISSALKLSSPSTIKKPSPSATKTSPLLIKKKALASASSAKPTSSRVPASSPTRIPTVVTVKQSSTIATSQIAPRRKRTSSIVSFLKRGIP